LLKAEHGETTLSHEAIRKLTGALRISREEVETAIDKVAKSG